MHSDTERIAPMQELATLIEEAFSLDKKVSLTPTGYSMLPMLRPGKDSVELSRIKEKLKKYDVILYRRDDGHYVLHRIVREGETYTCRGDHQFINEPGVREEQVIGVVTAFHRGEKTYTPGMLRYRLYCLMWHYSCGLRRCLYRPLRTIYHRLKG